MAKHFHIDTINQRGVTVHTISYGETNEQGFFNGRMVAHIHEETFLDAEHKAALETFLSKAFAANNTK